MKKLWTPIFLLFGTFLSAQTSLTQGDIAFLGFNLDGVDDYTFILLKDIDGSTTINFTDCGWVDGTSSFTCNTGDSNGWTWTSGSMLSIGQTVTISMNAPGLASSIGSVSGSAGVMSGLGDQIFAYQGSAASPTFISGMHSDQSPSSADDANWSGNVTNNQTSALPNDLTTGTNAIRLHNGGAEVDNWQYNCSTTSGDVVAIRNAINDISNWISDNNSAYSPADPGCTWSITPLPIELSSFHVSMNEKQEVKINWTTSSELNNDYFTVERSIDAKDWESLIIVNGSGTSLTVNHYEVFDTNPYPDLSYYRLKQTDFDGQFEYSEIVSMRNNHLNESSLINVYPNPTSDVVNLEGAISEIEDLLIYNQLGQNVKASVIIKTKAVNIITLDFINLPSGVYSLVNKAKVYRVYKH